MTRRRRRRTAAAAPTWRRGAPQSARCYGAEALRFGPAGAAVVTDTGRARYDADAGYEGRRVLGVGVADEHGRPFWRRLHRRGVRVRLPR